MSASPLSAGQVFGTERVVLGLAEHLGGWGVDTHVAAHAAPDSTDAVESKEIVPRRHVLPSKRPPSRRQYYRIRNDAPGFGELLETLQPDIVQFHGLAAAASNLRHLEIAREYGCRTILWHNVPGTTCLQTGLLRNGTTPCDGEVRVTRCTECRLRAFTLPGPAAWLAARTGLGRGSQALPRRPAAVAGARWLTGQFKQAVEEALSNLDAIRIGAEWVRDVLMRNGVPGERLHLIRPGVEVQGDTGAVADESGIWRRAGTGRPLRLIYWGRIHRSKGIHTIWQALAMAPELDLEVVIVGRADPTSPYSRELRAAAQRDPRLRLVGPVPADHILSTLRTADMALIPSRWHETGPITVFEARAAGLPIIGTDRGGIGELCRDDPGSRLFPAEDAEALAKALSELSNDPARLSTMRESVQPPRTMQDVSADVYRLYKKLCA